MLGTVLSRGFHVIGDTLEFGPFASFVINTAVIPEAERDFRRIKREMKKNPVKYEPKMEDLKNQEKVLKIILGQTEPSNEDDTKMVEDVRNIILDILPSAYQSEKDVKDHARSMLEIVQYQITDLTKKAEEEIDE